MLTSESTSTMEPIAGSNARRLHVLAPSRNGLFAEAARALGRVVAGASLHDEGRAVRVDEIDVVVVEAGDLERLLVAFLNELMRVGRDVQGVVVDCAVDVVDARHVRAQILSLLPDTPREPLHAVADDVLAVDVADDGFAATVTLTPEPSP